MNQNSMLPITATLASNSSSAVATKSPLHADVWRASSLGAAISPCVSSGFAALDAELPGGGWPTRCVSEILSAQHGSLEWRLLAPALRSLLTLPGEKAAAPRRPRPLSNSANRPLLLINPPHTPHLPGLQACGLPAEHMIWIATESAQQQLWALEQAIKANAAAAVLAWLPQARPEQIRRLQSCALGADAPIFLFRPWAAQQQSSAAPLRIGLSPGPDWCLQLHILKRRGPLHAGLLHLPALPAELAQVLTPRMLAMASSRLKPAPASAQRQTLEKPAQTTAARLVHTSSHHALARPALPARAH
ncbi:translesion DNA synthesis-associated protein ImuA [Roseateles sp. GG27B]